MIHEELTRRIIGAAMEVHRTLGCGYLEAVYQEALELELRAQGIVFVAQPEIELAYKGTALKHRYKPDFMVGGEVIVEIKAEAQLTDIDTAQTLNYLKGTGRKVGLVINFGTKSLQWKRLVF
jgi:GxxExxY protein